MTFSLSLLSYFQCHCDTSSFIKVSLTMLLDDAHTHIPSDVATSRDAYAKLD